MTHRTPTPVAALPFAPTRTPWLAPLHASVLAPLVALAFAPALAPPAAAQSTLQDKTSVVATDAGLFRVEEGDLADQVAGPAAFGGATSLAAPSITWIVGTDLFIVTQNDAAGFGTGGMWRVRVNPTGAAIVEDITPSPSLGIGTDFVDTDYSVGLDALFVMEDTTGTIRVLNDPAHRHGDALAPWGSYPPLLGTSIAVNGATGPFGVIVSLRTGPILRVTKEGTSTLASGAEGIFAQVAANPVTAEWYVMHQGEDLIGKLGSGFIIDMNASGFCPKLVKKPVDIVWDPVARRIVTMGEEELGTCAFGGLVVGPNHIVRLPLTAGGGPPSNQPVLLTFPGPSDIQGVKGDIAHVRHGGSDITFVGTPGVAGDGSSPEYTGGGYGVVLATGSPCSMQLASAPPSAPAFMVIGFTMAALPFKGQTLLPTPHVVVPLATDANGAALLTVNVPAVPELVGYKVYGQWWVEDTTTPAPGDLVSSRGAVYTIGIK